MTWRDWTDDLWMLMTGFVLGVLTVTMMSCTEPSAPCKCPKPGRFEHYVECLNTDIEGCEARYVRLSNEYADLLAAQTRRCN